MSKSEIRKAYLVKRQSLPEEEYNLYNGQLCDRFFASFDAASLHFLHTFIPIRKFREPNTWLIIDRLTTQFPETRIVVPAINETDQGLDNYVFEGAHQITENKWGVPEPTFGSRPADTDIDIVIVPLLAFDLQGYRIGYGKGYYDRFLSKCRPDCKKIGLSFFPPVEKIPSESFDKKLDAVITPDRTYTF